MDNEGNFSQQSLTNMQRAVYAGEMTVADYYERQIELKIAEKNGVDDGRACSKGKTFIKMLFKVRFFSFPLYSKHIIQHFLRDFKVKFLVAFFPVQECTKMMNSQ